MEVKLTLKNKIYTCIIDDEDYAKLLNYKLYIVQPNKSKHFYCRIYNKNNSPKMQCLHRFIMNCSKDLYVDHINGNGLDNRKENLRICTNKDNIRNQIKSKKRNKFQYKGVFKTKNKYRKFGAKIKVNYKTINLGSYHTVDEAAKAYNDAAIKYFGTYANLNKIEE